MLPYKQAHDAINIIRAIKAARITDRLNLLIRLSYASSQLISLSVTGVRLTVPTNPLVFTYSFYQIAGPADSDKELPGKANLSPVMVTLEIAIDVSGRKQVLARRKHGRQNDDYLYECQALKRANYGQ